MPKFLYFNNSDHASILCLLTLLSVISFAYKNLSILGIDFWMGVQNDFTLTPQFTLKNPLIS
jgi:hypothetical protein